MTKTVTKHTPGEWEFNELGDNRFISGANGRTICNLIHNARPLNIERANACLISAAPELLEVLKLFVRSNLHDGTGHILAKAKVTIAKAEGR